MDVRTVLPIDSPEVSALMEATGMKILNEHGQRKFGIPEELESNHTGRGRTTPGTEIYIQVPRHFCEVELFPIFEKIGKIRVIRTMMEFSHTNRGFCFIRFETEEEAQRAVSQLDNTEIETGQKIHVKESLDNTRLHLVLKNTAVKARNNILKELRKACSEVPINLWHTYELNYIAEYDTHRAAAVARRELLKVKSGLFAHVNWESLSSSHEVSEIRTVHIGGIDENVDDESLLAFLHEVLHQSGIEMDITELQQGLRRVRRFAFLEFPTYDEADAAIHALRRAVFYGKVLTASWATQRPKRNNRNRNNNEMYAETEPTTEITCCTAPMVQQTPGPGPAVPFYPRPLPPPPPGYVYGYMDPRFYLPPNYGIYYAPANFGPNGNFNGNFVMPPQPQPQPGQEEPYYQ